MPSSVGAASYMRDGEPKPASMRSARHVGTALQGIAQGGASLRRLILARRYAHHALEQALQDGTG